MLGILALGETEAGGHKFMTNVGYIRLQKTEIETRISLPTQRNSNLPSPKPACLSINQRNSLTYFCLIIVILPSSCQRNLPHPLEKARLYRDYKEAAQTLLSRLTQSKLYQLKATLTSHKHFSKADQAYPQA